MLFGALRTVRICCARVGATGKEMHTCMQSFGLWIFSSIEVYNLTVRDGYWTLDMALCTNSWLLYSCTKVKACALSAHLVQ